MDKITIITLTILILSLILLIIHFWVSSEGIRSEFTDTSRLFTDKNMALKVEYIQEMKYILGRIRIRKGVPYGKKSGLRVYTKQLFIRKFLPYYFLWWDGEEALPLVSTNRKNESGIYLATLFDIRELEYAYLGYVFIEMRGKTALIQSHFENTEWLNDKTIELWIVQGDNTQLAESRIFKLKELPETVFFDDAEIYTSQPVRLLQWYS